MRTTGRPNWALCCAAFALCALTTDLYAQAGKPKAEAPAPAATPSKSPAFPASDAVKAIQLEAIALLAVAPTEGRAVLQMPDKKMVTVNVGAPVPETKAVLKQVLADKVVFEETGAPGQGNQVVWMMKSGAGARIQRFSPNSPEVLSMQPPKDTEVSTTLGKGASDVGMSTRRAGK